MAAPDMVRSLHEPKTFNQFLAGFPEGLPAVRE
jgi:hypothetical protein